MPTHSASDFLFESWSELPVRKRYRLMQLLPFLEDPYARLIALREISRSKADYAYLISAPNSAELIVDLFTRGLSWIYEAPTAFAFAEIPSQGWIFTAPDAQFSEIPFGAFVEMDSAFTRYLRSQDERIFDGLLHELYTVKQSGKVDLLQAIHRIPYPYRIDAFRIYCRVREKVFTTYKNLFPKVKIQSKKEGNPNLDFRKIEDSTPLWHSLLFALAETPAYPGMHLAKAANLWEALTYLDEKAFQAEQAKKK